MVHFPSALFAPVRGERNSPRGSKQTGQKRSRLRVVAESLQLLGTKDGRPPKKSQPTQRPPVQHDPDLDVEPDDIPFLNG